MTSNAIWELCYAHSGTAEDFHRLEEELVRFNFQKSLLAAQRSELAAGQIAVTYFRRTGDASVIGIFNNGPTPYRNENPILYAILDIIPKGLYDANSATLAQWRFDYCIKPLRDGDFRQLLARQQEFGALVTEHEDQLPYKHLDEILAMIELRSMIFEIRRVVYDQGLVNEAIAACALERYRMEHNSYPDTLEAANRAGEKDIPLDVSGKPMGYRKTPDGRYALWCVGFDGKDDGGKRVITDPAHPERTRFADPDYLGDWVWDFPVKP
jgi:hypothetical protein